MKIFQTTLRNFAILGIDPKLRTSNIKAMATLSCYLFANVSCLMYLFQVDKDFRDYTLSIFMLFTSSTIAIVFAIILIRMEKVFELIGFCEEIIMKSKLPPFVQKMFQTINNFFKSKLKINF